MKHELKIWPQYFCRVADGSKTFEIRQNDWGYQPGDIVVLHEYDPTEQKHEESSPGGVTTWAWKEPRGYSGKKVAFRVGYVLPLDDNRVVFSLLPLPAQDMTEGK